MEWQSPPITLALHVVLCRIPRAIGFGKGKGKKQAAASHGGKAKKQ